jgi:DNA-binding protein H-NS
LKKAKYMAKSYEQLRKQIAELQAEAEQVRKKEVGEVIGRIREAIDHYGLSAADLGFRRGTDKADKAPKPGRKKPGRKPGAKAAKPATAALYRDEAGNTWGGRGKRPKWLHEALASGRKLEDLKVPQA